VKADFDTAKITLHPTWKCMLHVLTTEVSEYRGKSRCFRSTSETSCVWLFTVATQWRAKEI